MNASLVHDGLRINGVLLYHKNTTLLHSTIYHCQSDNLTACPHALLGNPGVVPEVLAGATEQSQMFLTDLARHNMYTGLLAVPSDTEDPTAPAAPAASQTDALDEKQKKKLARKAHKKEVKLERRERRKEKSARKKKEKEKRKVVNKQHSKMMGQ